MSAIWLAIVKILADALTAASGVYGLLREFKDEKHQITPAGKKALAGIAAGLILAVTMTVIETRRSQIEECQHAEEVSNYANQLDRLEHPLGDLKVHLSLAMPMSGSSPISRANQKLYTYLSGRLGKGNSADTGVAIDTSALPRHLLNGAYKWSAPHIKIYKSKACEQVKAWDTTADLELTLPEEAVSSISEVMQQLQTPRVNAPTMVLFSALPPPDGPLIAEKDFRLAVKNNSGGIVSTSDLNGSTIVFTSTGADFYFLEPLALDLTVAKGLTLHVPPKGFTILKDQYEFARDDTPPGGPAYKTKPFMYCYTFPRTETKTRSQRECSE